MSARTTKKASRRKGGARAGGMRREYRFDYRTGRPNRFAGEFRGRTAVVLDADVASVFGSSESVNQLLRSVIAAGIFTFILAWNDFLFALVLITSEELKTLPVGVNDLFNATIVDWGMIMAAGVVITVPTIVFFVAVQRYLIQGWGAGGVKG